MPATTSATSELSAGGTGRSGAAFDLGALVRRCMDDPTLAAMLVDRFTSRLDQSVRDVERALGDSDWPAANSRIHALKGEAGSLAAGPLHAAATRLEQCLRSGRHAEAPAALRQVQTAAAACSAAAPLALDELRRLAQAGSEQPEEPPCAP